MVKLNLRSKRIQYDEIWSFCYAREKNVPEDKKGRFGYGDVYTFTAICADTNYVERQSLTMRMSMRRFTRLTNAFSKKVENLSHAVALHFMYYNFCQIHQTLRVTPAMEAGVTEHVLEIENIIALIK